MDSISRFSAFVKFISLLENRRKEFSGDTDRIFDLYYIFLKRKDECLEACGSTASSAYGIMTAKLLERMNIMSDIPDDLLRYRDKYLIEKTWLIMSREIEPLSSWIYHLEEIPEEIVEINPYQPIMALLQIGATLWYENGFLSFGGRGVNLRMSTEDLREELSRVEEPVLPDYDFLHLR